MLTWIDRLAIVWAIFVFAMLAILASPTPDGWGMAKILFWAAAVPWAVLHGIRWVVTGGPRNCY